MQMESFSMVIDGRLVQTPEQDEVINPATGAAFATCARASRANIDAAVAAAGRALPAWRADEGMRRQKLIECATAIQGQAAEIAQVLTREQGKPLAKAMEEIFAAAFWLTFFAGLEIKSEVIQDDASKRIRIIHKPLGVVAAITPWNFPVVLLAFKLGPALLAGNTVVVKPSEYTPLSSLLLAKIIKDILPAGVVNFLAGPGSVGAELASHPDVRKVSFTGSVATGKKIAQNAAADLKRVTLELGGNDPAIVLPDVDPAKIIDSLFWGAFANSGQICTAIKRLYIHEDVYAPIVDGLIERARSIKVGDGLDAESQLGPINNRMQFERVLGLVEDARKNGGRVLVGGEPLPGDGYFLPPTIVADIAAGVRLVDEEQFGTALPVIRYRDLDAVFAEANQGHFGLGGSIWTSDIERGEKLIQRLESGTGWVNHHMDILPNVPFGGCKWSGLGYEGGRWGYEEFTELQVVNSKK